MLLAGERFAICLLPAVFSRAAVLGEKATTAENMRCDDANRDATKATGQEQVRIIKLHKRRADRFTLLWLGFALLLLTGFRVVLDHFAIAAAERTGVMIILAPLILIAAVWQAVGLGVAGAPMLMKGINLER